ncbi:hypothetical protein WN51_09849 [Melipona quadrifasciata]|uniref:Uncharacterized protein n=1 Tax=Melipona quadrifasciata TaxID=166423 RepID=A0A0M9A5A3_9HYME|nr:hypothetical protein WN51_09849 [Melipona quadrifasciata]
MATKISLLHCDSFSIQNYYHILQTPLVQHSFSSPTRCEVLLGRHFHVTIKTSIGRLFAKPTYRSRDPVTTMRVFKSISYSQLIGTLHKANIIHNIVLQHIIFNKSIIIRNLGLIVESLTIILRTRLFLKLRHSALGSSLSPFYQVQSVKPDTTAILSELSYLRFFARDFKETDQKMRLLSYIAMPNTAETIVSKVEVKQKRKHVYFIKVGRIFQTLTKSASLRIYKISTSDLRIDYFDHFDSSSTNDKRNEVMKSTGLVELTGEDLFVERKRYATRTGAVTLLHYFLKINYNKFYICSFANANEKAPLALLLRADVGAHDSFGRLGGINFADPKNLELLASQTSSKEKFQKFTISSYKPVETKELGRSTAYYPARSTFPPCNDPSFCSNCCNIVPPCSHPDTDNAYTGGNPIRLPINIYLDGRGKRRDRDTPCEPPIKNSTGPESLHRLINIPAFIVSASRCGPLRDFLVNRQAGWCRPRKPGQDVGAEGADADAGFNLRYPKDNGGLSLALSAVTYVHTWGK